MNKKIIGTFLLLWLLTASLAVQAESPVWKVSKDGDYLYLGGTIHLLGKSDYPLPNAFGRAYDDADTVVLETDIGALEAPEYQQEILRKGTYTNGNSVLDELSPDTIALLKGYLQDRGMPATPLFRLKPGMLSITLTVMELHRLGFTEAGVDDHFRSRALDDGKDLAYLESAGDQIEFLLNMGKGQEDELIHHTISEMELLPRLMDELKRAWRAGDTRALETIGVDTWAGQFPDLYDTLLVDRNHNWLPQIERMLANDDTELVLFGALHLVGDDGILALLEARGYDLERLN